MSEKQLTLPVIGMTCANCVAAVERNAKKAEGVTDATVNFAAEKVTVSYDLEKVGGAEVAADVIERIRRAGYDVPTAEVELPLLGMTCANCAATIERRLKKTDGVLDATVNLASERATVRYAPGATTRADLVAAVRRAGYESSRRRPTRTPPTPKPPPAKRRSPTSSAGCASACCSRCPSSC